MLTERPEVTSATTGYRYRLGDLFWEDSHPIKYYILTKFLSDKSPTIRRNHVLVQLQPLTLEKLVKDFPGEGNIDEIFHRHKNHLTKNIRLYFEGEPFQFSPDERKVRWLSSPGEIWRGLEHYEDDLDNWV